jgi:hypothetical protein
MGPLQRRRQASSLQDFPQHKGRSRICLMKGCEQPFQPSHPLSRYCSLACREAARRWRQQTANRHYRGSDQGKCRRREQSCRYRARVRDRRRAESEVESGCEGYHHPSEGGNSFCCRPGCYERFTRTSRSPLQKFCSLVCGIALRRVLTRERRLYRRRKRVRTSTNRADEFW